MEQLQRGGVKHFTIDFRQDDGTLVTPTNPRVVFTDPIAGITSVSLLQEGEAVGYFSRDFTIPDNAALQTYDWFYEGTYPPYAGANPEINTSEPYSFQVVAALDDDPVIAVGLNANALTTLARVNDAVAAPCSDARVRFLINEVSQHMEDFTGRVLGFTVVKEAAPDRYSGNGTNELHLRRLPIRTITRVRVYEAEVTNYKRTTDNDKIGCLLRGWPMVVEGWPDLTGDRRRVETLNIDVCGSFGFILPRDASTGRPQTLPASIEGACIREVVRRAFRPAPGIRREKTPGAWELEWEKQDNNYGFADETIAALNPYCLPSRWFS